jgi:peptidoglycan/xylan/chitin deacetylase (PgdA/CDA1 family)
MAELSGISLHFDSLGWALSLNRQESLDPTFFRVADRFFLRAHKYGFQFTIFVIGQDLENPEVAARVKDWHSQGHEIANHSYHHKANLGSLSYHEIEDEVMRSHDVISKACGSEPQGFTAPAWATSADLVDVLTKHNYLYDTSLFPSYFMWLISAKLYWNFRGDSRRNSMLQRRDRWKNLLGRRMPHFAHGAAAPNGQRRRLLIVPLPVSPYLRIPCWHTMTFVLAGRLFQKVLRSTLRQRYFYYVVHPADLMDLSDMGPGHRSPHGVFERMGLPIASKESLLDDSLAVIRRHSRQVVPLKTIAQAVAVAADRDSSAFTHSKTSLCSPGNGDRA